MGKKRYRMPEPDPTVEEPGIFLWLLLAIMILVALLALAGGVATVYAYYM